MYEIPVEQVSHVALDERHLEDAINARLRTPRKIWIPLLIGGTAAVLLAMIHAAFFGLAAVITGFLAYKTHQADQEARTTTLEYDADALAAERTQFLDRAYATLSKTQRLWIIDTESRITDWKRNAGANALVSRRPATPSRRMPPYIRSNGVPFALVLGRASLHFLPDRVLVWDGGQYATCTYSSLIVRASETNFIEHDRTALDATVVGHTWQYANKNGGPDRRFRDNRQLPIMRYGVIELGSRAGFAVHLETSNRMIAPEFVSLLSSAIAATP